MIKRNAMISSESKVKLWESTKKRADTRMIRVINLLYDATVGYPLDLDLGPLSIQSWPPLADLQCASATLSRKNNRKKNPKQQRDARGTLHDERAMNTRNRNCVCTEIISAYLLPRRSVA